MQLSDRLGALTAAARFADTLMCLSLDRGSTWIGSRQLQPGTRPMTSSGHGKVRSLNICGHVQRAQVQLEDRNDIVACM